MYFSDWAYLPIPLLELVLKKLASLSDYVRFSVVCKSWYSVAKDEHNQRAKLMSICHHPPMLMICADKEDTWNLYNVMEDKLLDLQLSLPNKRFCGSSKGWLIAMDENFIVTLINPFFKVRGRKEKENSVICLPPLTPLKGECKATWSKRCDNYIFKATISADPVLTPNDCIVSVIYRPVCQLAFIRLGIDTTWTYINVPIGRKRWRHIEEVVHVDNKLYSIDYWRQVLSIDSTAQSNLDDEEPVARHIERKNGYFYLVKNYLVNSDKKELLMVQKYYYYDEDDDDKRVTTKFKVYELDFDKHQWAEKRTLGDFSLFLGDNSSIYVTASSFSGCLSNCIYFNHDDDHEGSAYKGLHDFGVYDLKSKTFLPIDTTHAAKLVKNSKQPSIWVVPTFQL